MNRTRHLLCLAFSLLFAGAAQAQFSISGLPGNLLDSRQAGASAAISAGKLSTITVRNGGSGYSSAPAVTVGPPGAGGTTATATATINAGVVTSIAVTSMGSGYLHAPTVKIDPPSVPTGTPTTTPQYAGMASTSATAGALHTTGAYPNNATSAAPTVFTVVLARANMGYSFASGVPLYYMGDVIQVPKTNVVGTTVTQSYWRSVPVKPGEQFTTVLNGTPGMVAAGTAVIPLGSVNVVSSSIASSTVTVDGNAPSNFTSGCTLLGQKVNYVNGTAVVLAGNANATVTSSTPKPFTPTLTYYYSPHADLVFASQPGQVKVTWVSSAPDTSMPGETAPTYKYITQTFTVSSATKSPVRPMFWTEKSFNGPLITIPSGRISTVNVVFNTYVPGYVAGEVVPVGYVAPTDPGATPPSEHRTVWYDNTGGTASLHSYNLEGRVFVEYLGGLQPGASGDVHVFLGADIIEVKRAADPVIITTDLGQQLQPYQTLSQAQPGDTELTAHLVASVIQPAKPLYGTTILPNGSTIYYAEQVNTDPDSIQIYWLETDDAAIDFNQPKNLNIHWPRYLCAYLQQWPQSLSQYQPMEVTPTGNDVSSGPQFPGGNVPTVVAESDPAANEVTVDANTQRLLVNFNGSGSSFVEVLLKFANNLNLPWYVPVYAQSGDALGTPAVTDPVTGDVVTPAMPTINDPLATGSPEFSATYNVGDRILPPSGEYSVAGYIAEGTCYYPAGYLNPFTSGVQAAEKGAVIPVNTITATGNGGNKLVVWWFRKVVPPDNSYPSFYLPAASGHYTVQYPAGAPQIVIASGLGSGKLGTDQSGGIIYYQNDISQPGYNPNEEHGVIVDGTAYALRSDLNKPATTSQPFVLLAYVNSADGRPSMDVYQVLSSTPQYPFDYNAVAGTPLQVPAPLLFLPLPLDANNNVLNTEVPGAPDLPVGVNAPVADGKPAANYKLFTYTDRKGYQWTYRGAHNKGTPTFGMRLYYVSQAGFFVPDQASQPAPGTIMPFAAKDNTTTNDGSGDGYGTAITLTFTPKWPDEPPLAAVVPVMQTGQTLTLPVNGLPQVRGQTSAQVLYDQSIANTTTSRADGTANNSVLLHDPTREKIQFLNQAGLSKLPASASTTTYNGKTYFQKLPPNLQQRFYFDPNQGAIGGLVLTGQFVKQATGLNYILLNALSADEIHTLEGIVPTTDSVNSPLWNAAIAALSTTVQTFHKDSTTQLYVPDATMNQNVGVMTLPEITTPEQAVDSYALTATGKGEGYVTLLFGNGNAFTNPGDPVVMQVIKVVPGLYTGEVEVITASNPLDEQVSLRQSNDFAAHPELYDFEWRYGFDNDGNPPPVGTAATAIANISGGGVSNITLTGFGTAYNQSAGAPAVTISAPQSGTQATATASIANGVVTAITITNPGSGYSSVPTVTIAAPVNISIAGSTSDWIKPGGVLSDHILVGGSVTATISNPTVLLGDTWFTMSYRLKASGNGTPSVWSSWTQPQLVEGWIKRVLNGITPFNQREAGLLNNSINTQVSLLTQAGTRWEGDIALNLNNVNDFGLIQIYQTVLDRGESFSIDSGIDAASADSALLLAASALNDLYVILGNEAYADAANPTISVNEQSTATQISTSRFSFEGQVSSFLGEETTLLRGRDDFAAPGVGVAPVYNRLYWNFTGGVNSGEAIYAINYNISDQNADGQVNAADAAVMYPQGHGDAYGHYLTALTGYYKLLENPYFTWTPHAEAVTVVGQAVQVNYQEERKFAASAAHLAQTAEQVCALAFRADYKDDPNSGWSQFRDATPNPNTGVTRNQGLDEWVSRSSQGAYFNWVVGNALLPDKDTDPSHQGVQIVDRTTVPELAQLVTASASLESTMDNANGHLNPLGLSSGAIPFDISPTALQSGTSHYQQVNTRALQAVINAAGAFNQAAVMTGVLRNLQNQTASESIAVSNQQQAYQNQLIAIFGLPYAGDIGPGKIYQQGYAGPDLYDWMLIDRPSNIVDDAELTNQITVTVPVGVTQPPVFDSSTTAATYLNGSKPVNTKDMTVTVSTNRMPQFSDTYGLKQPAYGSRGSVGTLQQALNAQYLAQVALLQSCATFNVNYAAFQRQDKLLTGNLAERSVQLTAQSAASLALIAIAQAKAIALNAAAYFKNIGDAASGDIAAVADAVPKVEGLADDALAPVRGSIEAAGNTAKGFLLAANASWVSVANEADVNTVITNNALAVTNQVANFTGQEQADLANFAATYSALVTSQFDIASKQTALMQAYGNLVTILNQANEILALQRSYNNQAAAVIAGYRLNDLGFRTFRDESLEQYRQLFDLAAQYSYLAAKSYDYETGLLGSKQGQSVFASIVSSRSLGALANNQPQATVSTLGDAGLAGYMAELNADFSVAQGRLGINNPDQYGTLFSLRQELFRIPVDGATADNNAQWTQVLQEYTVADVTADQDVARLCNNIAKADGSAAPGIVIPFSTTITQGQNFFGLPLAGGDHDFTSSSFSTKIYSVGVVFPGYVGMDSTTTGSASSSNHANALSATPYVYFIPCGVDTMLAPPLGATNTARSWMVSDQALPLPYNLGGTAFNGNQFMNADGTLSEQPWILRKHQAFRAVGNPSIFLGSSVPVQYTNSRLVARSVWNSRWKIVIPAYTLESNEQDGLTRFVNSVSDIGLYLKTYSYSGN